MGHRYDVASHSLGILLTRGILSHTVTGHPPGHLTSLPWAMWTIIIWGFPWVRATRLGFRATQLAGHQEPLTW